MAKLGQELDAVEWGLWKEASAKDIVEHLEFITKTCLDVEAQVILELGVRFGNSNGALAKAASILGARLISVDIEDCSASGTYDKWEFHQCNSLDFGIDDSIDVLFIDTSHTFGQTLMELEKFAPLVRRGGVILMHDTISCPDVYAAIKYYLKDKHEYEFIHRTNNNGLGVLWKRV